MPAVDKLKKELTKFIEETNDVELLALVKEDIAFYKTKGADITDSLSNEQVKELEKLASEPDNKDTMTIKEFNKATYKWRMK